MNPTRYETLLLRVPVWPDDHKLGQSGRQRQKFRAAARDGWRCQINGCWTKRKLQAHHIRPRSAGGSDNLDNLITVCPRHHNQIHEQGLVEQMAESFRQKIEDNRKRAASGALGTFLLWILRHSPKEKSP